MVKASPTRKTTKSGSNSTPRPRSTKTGAQSGAPVDALPDGVEIIDGKPMRKMIVGGRPRYVVAD